MLGGSFVGGFLFALRGAREEELAKRHCERAARTMRPQLEVIIACVDPYGLGDYREQHARVRASFNGEMLRSGVGVDVALLELPEPRIKKNRQGDLQELLRMLTARKLSMIAAMGQVKALQAKNLRRTSLANARRSIAQIAEAPLASIQDALDDPKIAKSLHTACKSHGKKLKRSADDAVDDGAAKKPRLEVHRRDLDYSAMSPEDLEEALRLPLVEDEEVLRGTTVVTNRAPLMLAFAVEMLRCTMPEQPRSSRLSLAQGVVSANSRTKAVSLGISKPGSTGEDQISEGQPKVSIMGRQIPVLKRGGYSVPGASKLAASSTATQNGYQEAKTWTASQKRSLKSSTFIAHAAPITSPSSRGDLVTSLMAAKPELETANHNAWAIRTSYGNSPLNQEASFDDGESGCGAFLLQHMRNLHITNTVVVLTRWYGGVMLGPDRWRLMRECLDDALSSQRRTSNLSSGEAVWALDPQDTKPATTTVGMGIHRPEGARNYLLRSFHAAESTGKKTVAAANEERLENLGRVLGSLRLLFESWREVLTPAEMDRRAWTWYVAVRPDVEAGPGGWGAKGTLALERVLNLRRKSDDG
ncbi:hypothetical protein G7046_g9311 [Stylonectria norvegica]|nr:hypothetical protein G7046_g9311 [Stylonectria norvegica]